MGIFTPSFTPHPHDRPLHSPGTFAALMAPAATGAVDRHTPKVVARLSADNAPSIVTSINRMDGCIEIPESCKYFDGQGSHNRRFNAHADAAASATRRDPAGPGWPVRESPRRGYRAETPLHLPSAHSYRSARHRCRLPRTANFRSG